MVTEEGVVTSATSSMAWIKTVRSKACDSCDAKDSCHSQDPSRDMLIQVNNTINAKTGDRVVLGFQTAPLLKLSFMLYVFPIILMIIGAAAGQTAAPALETDPTLTSVLSGLASFGIAFGVIRLAGNRLAGKTEYRPFLIRILN